MRVLHIGKFYPPCAGGIENFMGDLLPALQTVGVQTGALVHAHAARLGGRQQAVAIGGSPVWRTPSWGSVLYTPVSPAFPLWLQRCLRDFEPDLLHFHLPNPSAFWAMGLPAARTLPWLIHWHADVVASRIDRRLALAYQFYRPFEQKFLALAQRVIVTSPPYLASSEPLRPWQEKTEIVPLGLDPERWKTLPEPEARAWATKMWGDAGLRILAVGRLSYYKGHEYLIRAAAGRPGVKVVIVGDGENRRRLEAALTSSQAGERIALVGSQPLARLQALLTSCDCLCLPSLERTEAFGLVLLEAMCQSKPVIAGDIPGSGVGWVVEHEKTGLLVPPADTAALVSAIEKMMQSAEMSRHMGRAGQKRFERFFQIGEIARQMKAVYAGVLG